MPATSLTRNNNYHCPAVLASLEALAGFSNGCSAFTLGIMTICTHEKY